MILDNSNIIEFREWLLEYPHMKTIDEVELLLTMATRWFELCKRENEKLKTNHSAERLFIAGYNKRTYEMVLQKKKELREKTPEVKVKVKENDKNGQYQFIL